jgi:hypothetical protein
MKPDALMTPEEYLIGKLPAHSLGSTGRPEGHYPFFWERKHREAILNARDNQQPFSAIAADKYGIKIDSWFKRVGDEYRKA